MNQKCRNKVKMKQHLQILCKNEVEKAEMKQDVSGNETDNIKMTHKTQK